MKIQSAFRGFTQRRRYHQQRAAAIILQRRFRVLQLARVEEENLRRRHSAAVYLQAFWRGWLARQQARNVISKAVHKLLTIEVLFLHPASWSRLLNAHP